MKSIQELIKEIEYPNTNNVNLVFDFETTTPPKDFIYESTAKSSRQLFNELKTEVWAGCYARLDKNDDCVHSRSIDEFMQQILNINDNVNLYSFNGAKFDNYFIIHWLLNSEFDYVSNVEYAGLREKYWCGDADLFTIYNNGYFYNFIDSRKLLVGQSIKSMGNILSDKYDLDLHKGDTPLLEEKPSDDDERWAEWIDYIERDVLILKLIMEDEHMLIHRLVENNILTQASWAFKTLKFEQHINLNERPLKPLKSSKKPKLDKYETIDQWFTKEINGKEELHYITRKMTDSEKRAEKERIAKIKEQMKNQLTNNSTLISDADLRKRPKVKTKAKSKTNEIIVELKQKLKDAKDDTEKKDVALKLKQESFKIFTKVINDLAKSCYRGGLCMVGPKYICGLIDYGQVLDYTSHYPAIYGYERLPGLVKEINNRITELSEIDLNELSITHFKHLHAKCKKDRLPIFKPKTDDKNNVYISEHLMAEGIIFDKRHAYPREIDFVDYALPHCELKYLLENYTIYSYEIKRVYYFEENKELMRLCRIHVDKWIEVKEQARRDKNKTLEMLAKIMLNAPYGKFGNYDKLYPVYNYTLGANGSILEVKVDDDKGGRDNAEVPVAAYITAYGRVKLANEVNIIGYDRFIYCDTDSIHIKGWEDVPPEVNTSGDLGCLKHEGYFKDGYYIKSKTYGEYTLIDKEEDYQRYVKENEEDNAGHILKVDEDGKFIWDTTCAGLSVTVPPEQFNVGTRVLDKRSFKTHGGISIIPTYMEIKPISYGYARLVEYEEGIKIPEQYVEDGEIYQDDIRALRNKLGYQDELAVTINENTFNKALNVADKYL